MGQVERQLLVVFKVGPVTCAVPALDIERLVRAPDFLTRIPLAPAAVVGVFSDRTQPIVAVCVREKLGLPAREDKSTGNLMLARIDGEKVGLWIDETLDVITPDVVPEAPPIPQTVFDGVFEFRGRLALTTDARTLCEMPCAELGSALPPALLEEARREMEIDAAAADPTGGDNADSTHVSPGASAKADFRDGVVAPPSVPRPGSNGNGRATPSKPSACVPERVIPSAKPAAKVPAAPTTKTELRPAPPVASPPSDGGPTDPAPQRRMSDPAERRGREDDADSTHVAPSASANAGLRDGVVAPPSVPGPGPHGDGRATPSKPSACVPERINPPAKPAAKVPAAPTTKTELRPAPPVASPPSDGGPADPAPQGRMSDPGARLERKDSPRRLRFGIAAALAAAVLVALGIVFGVSPDGRDVVQPTRERPALGTRDPTRSSSRDSVEADVVLVVSAPGGSRADDPSAVRETLGSSATRSDSTIIHVVKKGDTLWDITERYLGDPFQYPIVAVWSRIPDPHWIEPGDIVRIIILGGRGG